jgi:uncharacterized protein (TIGR02679 family)
VVIDRPSLTADGLDEVWERVRVRLERRGADNRGRVTLPILGTRARLTLGSLLGGTPGRTVDLAALEQSLVALDLGPDLAEALAALGHPVSKDPARRRSERAKGRAARAAARTEAASWPEPWAPAWIDEVIRAGGVRDLDATGAMRFVRTVRRVLDLLQRQATTGTPVGRGRFAADHLGSAHDLDAGTRLEAACTRALVHRFGPGERRDLWERAGAHLDLTSGPVLTWRLPISASSSLAALTDGATALGLPLHLTWFALDRHPVAVNPVAVVLVVENPYIVEAAAQADVPTPLVAANGNPSNAVRLLLTQLLGAGATVRYHGDFDTAGLAMCARMAALGLAPWRMDAADYLAAVAVADDAGVELPVDAAPPGPTPWDPSLQATFDRRRLIVHEERLLPSLLHD